MKLSVCVWSKMGITCINEHMWTDSAVRCFLTSPYCPLLVLAESCFSSSATLNHRWSPWSWDVVIKCGEITRESFRFLNCTFKCVWICVRSASYSKQIGINCVKWPLSKASVQREVGVCCKVGHLWQLGTKSRFQNMSRLCVCEGKTNWL